MTYREQIAENFKDDDKSISNVTTTCLFVESLSTVAIWICYGMMKHSGLTEDDMVDVNAVMERMGTDGLSLEHMATHFQLMGFVTWLLDQECPEFDEERGAWCQTQIVIDKYNEWVDMRKEWYSESEGE